MFIAIIWFLGAIITACLLPFIAAKRLDTSYAEALKDFLDDEDNIMTLANIFFFWPIILSVFMFWVVIYAIGDILKFFLEVLKNELFHN